MTRGALAVALVVISFAACATNPVSGKREISLMSEAEEIAYGQQADAEIRREMGVYDNPELQHYVSDIGQRLARLSHRPNLRWSFTVVDHQAVNAFALPGGFIYLTRGILPYLDNEAELAGVLGHEIVHVTARHAAQQSTRAGLGGLGLAVLGIFVPSTQPFGDLTSAALGIAFLKYGRDDERESDRVGMEYVARAGWDPSGVPNFLQTLARISEMSERGVPNWLSTHPEPAQRVIEAQPVVSKLAGAAAVERGRDRYLDHIEGIVVGDNPEDGIVRGHQFLHPALRFALEFPEGWDVINTPEQVAAQEPGQKRFMVFQHVDRPIGNTLEAIATRSMSSGRWKRVDGAATSINGAEAFVGLYRGSLSGVGPVLARAAHIRQGRQIYLFAGFAPETEFTSADKDFATSIQSYRPLSSSEAAAIRPNRLEFYVVRPGDTWQSIASRGGSLVRATDLAIMNSAAVNVQPTPGQRIKIVVAG
jgi:predicted Zn-dependent protease